MGAVAALRHELVEWGRFGHALWHPSNEDRQNTSRHAFCIVLCGRLIGEAAESSIGEHVVSAQDSQAGQSRPLQQYDKLRDLADCHAATGDCERAGDCYRRAARLMPQRPEAYVGLGSLAIQGNDLEGAHWAFATARDVAPNCAEAYSGLAMVCQQRQQYSAAFDYYLKTLELNSDNLLALLGLFQASMQMGTFSKIIRYLEIYLARHADDVSVLFCLATLYAREGMLPQARRATLRVLELDPHKAEAHDLMMQIEASRPMEAMAS